MKSKIKDIYRRFKAWQNKPFSYEFGTMDSRQCANCGHTFVGNYCPYCSQKAGTGRLTWKHVRDGALDVWALGARSMPLTLWQLLWRPGHLVGDYLCGKRQVSFPPVKMLIVVGVIVALIEYFTGLGTKMVDIDPTDEFASFLRPALQWYDSHLGWGVLIVCSLLIFPTWLLFRHSPRNTRHTFPEGFYIQVFVAVLILILGLIDDIPGMPWVTVLVPVYQFAIYKHLFGYGVWGTLWRVLTVIFVGAITGIFAAVMAFYIATSEDKIFGTVVAIILYVMFVGIILGTAYLISRRTGKLRLKKQEGNES